jgi:hypothetical protein
MNTYIDCDGYAWKKRKPSPRFNFKGTINYGGGKYKVYEYIGLIEVENGRGFVCEIPQLWRNISLHRKIYELFQSADITGVGK